MSKAPTATTKYIRDIFATGRAFTRKELLAELAQYVELNDNIRQSVSSFLHNHVKSGTLVKEGKAYRLPRPEDRMKSSEPESTAVWNMIGTTPAVIQPEEEPSEGIKKIRELVNEMLSPVQKIDDLLVDEWFFKGMSRKERFRAVKMMNAIMEAAEKLSTAVSGS